MKSAQGTGKTVEEAVENALNQLHITKADAQITIETEGSKGLFGIGSKPAVVTVKKKPEEKSLAAEFIIGLCGRMGVRVTVDEAETEDGYKLTLKSDTMGMLIGYRGDTLDSLQYLTNLVVHRNTQEYKRVTLDSENYRSKRQHTLERLANKYASRARATGRSVSLEPMKPYERRVLHATLQNNEHVTTYSEGEEPYRRVVIKPR
jgi:spoIIIJ-associated protein